MKTGNIITVEISTKKVSLMLDDEVLPDRTCGQYDHGFWAFELGNEDNEFFVSSDGIVYGEDPNIEPVCSYTIEVGKVIENG